MKSTIESTALDMIKEAGLINLSRRELCDRAGISDGSFIHVMGITFNDFVEKLRKTHKVEPDTIVIRARTNPDLRKEHILLCAVKESQRVGYNKITREGIADHAGVSVGLVSNYFNTMTQLRRDIMRYAIKHECIDVLAQGLIMRDRHAMKASDHLKQKVTEYIGSL